ncbi:MAG: DUF6263 family protein [Chitinophagales bacterium]
MKYLVALLAFSCISVLAQGQYALALNLQKGNTYFLKINSTIDVNSEMNGEKMPVNSIMNAIARCKVVNASDMDYELEVSYDSMHLSIKSPMGYIEFGSGPSSSKVNMMPGPFGGMMNQRMTVTVLKNGAVSKIKGPDTTGFSSMLKRYPQIDQLKKMLFMGHMKHFDKEAMKKNLEMMTAIFPNKKVSLHEEWGASIQPDSIMNHSMKTSYQLVDYKGGLATIQGHSTSSSTGMQKQNNDFPGTYNLNGKTESTIVVDANTGWVKQAEIRNDLSGQIQLKDSPMVKGGKTIPVQMAVVSRITD